MRCREGERGLNCPYARLACLSEALQSPLVDARAATERRRAAEWRAEDEKIRLRLTEAARAHSADPGLLLLRVIAMHPLALLLQLTTSGEDRGAPSEAGLEAWRCEALHARCIIAAVECYGLPARALASLKSFNPQTCLNLDRGPSQCMKRRG